MSRCHKTIFFGTLVEDGWFARDAHIILQYIPVTVTHMPAGMGHPSMCAGIPVAVTSFLRVEKAFEVPLARLTRLHAGHLVQCCCLFIH